MALMKPLNVEFESSKSIQGHTYIVEANKKEKPEFRHISMALDVIRVAVEIGNSVNYPKTLFYIQEWVLKWT